MIDDDLGLAVHAGFEEIAAAFDVDMCFIYFEVRVGPHALGVGEKFRGEIRYLTDILDELMLNEKLYKGES